MGPIATRPCALLGATYQMPSVLLLVLAIARILTPIQASTALHRFVVLAVKMVTAQHPVLVFANKVGLALFAVLLSAHQAVILLMENAYFPIRAAVLGDGLD